MSGHCQPRACRGRADKGMRQVRAHDQHVGEGIQRTGPDQHIREQAEPVAGPPATYNAPRAPPPGVHGGGAARHRGLVY